MDGIGGGASSGRDEKKVAACDVDALRKCLEENKGDRVKCQAHIDAFRSSPVTPPAPTPSRSRGPRVRTESPIANAADKSFTFILKTPPASVLLLKAAGIEKGSKEPQREKVGKVTADQVRAIAQEKLPDLNCKSID